MTIEVSSLSKEYKLGGKIIRVVDDLTLSVQNGEVVSFLGANGAGKTTTIKMICGLITPSAGQIRLNGFDIARQPRQALTQIGVVLEGARNIYWRLSAWENLLYFGRVRGHADKQTKRIAEQLLRELDLWDRRNDPTRNFSRGMQQKIAIASALITDPPIVLLDEPTLGLDVEAAKVVESWLTILAHERGKTILLTTHQLDMAQKVSDRVAIIEKGRLIANQPVAALLELSQHSTYQIKVKGDIKPGDFPWLNSFTLTPEILDTTLISGIADEDSLYDLLAKLREANLTLIAATRDEPQLEETFIHLLYRDRKTRGSITNAVPVPAKSVAE